MPSYLVETFLPRSHAGTLAACEQRARSAAETLTQAGNSVSFEVAIHVPCDEMCFFVFDAATSGDALLAARNAELDPFRVVEAVSSRKHEEE